MNNSDERDYAEEAANRRLMEEEHESDDSTHCPICARLWSTHIICDGPDAPDNWRDYDILPDPFN